MVEAIELVRFRIDVWMVGSWLIILGYGAKLGWVGLRFVLDPFSFVRRAEGMRTNEENMDRRSQKIESKSKK